MLNKLANLFHDPNSKFRKVATNIIWLFADRILAIAMAFLVSAIVARYLGPTQLGTLKYVSAFVFLFSPLSSLGMNTVVIRELVQDLFSRNEILGTALFLRLICGVVSASLSIFGILLFSPHDSNIQFLVAILSSTFLFNAFGVVEDWFNSQVEAKYIVLSKNITLFTLSAVKISLVHYKAPLSLFIGSTVLETVIYSTFLLVFYYKSNANFGLSKWKVKWSRARYSKGISTTSSEWCCRQYIFDD